MYQLALQAGLILENACGITKKGQKYRVKRAQLWDFVFHFITFRVFTKQRFRELKDVCFWRF